MKKKLFSFILLAALVTPAICSAAPPRMGPYFSGFAGIAIPSNTDSTAFDINDRVEFDPGINIGGTAGFDFGYLRMEGELSYKHGEISRVNSRTDGDVFTDIDGSIGALAMMGNLFVDLHNPGPITPYFGGGIGFAAMHQSDVFGTSTLNGDPTRVYRSDDDTVFAWQAGAGLEMALSRRLSLDLGYRYFKTLKATFNRDTSVENDLKFESHNVAVGVRVKF